MRLFIRRLGLVWLSFNCALCRSHVTLPGREDKPELLEHVVDCDDVGGGDEVDETVVAGPRAITGALLNEARVDWSAQETFLLLGVMKSDFRSNTICLKPVV